MSNDNASAQIAAGRQWMAEAFAGFVNDPPDDDFQRGYLGALYVVALELFGMDPGPDVPQPELRERNRSHLRVIK